MVKYCSIECQRRAWPTHKRCCSAEKGKTDRRAALVLEFLCVAPDGPARSSDDLFRRVLSFVGGDYVAPEVDHRPEQRLLGLLRPAFFILHM